MSGLVDLIGKIEAQKASTPVVQATREELLEVERRRTLSHHTAEQCCAALSLYKLVKRCRDTGGGVRATKFLLGLYNGDRFPFDLTDLRSFDAVQFEAAILLLRLEHDSRWVEVHTLLDAILGAGANCGAEFEHWAYDLGLPRSCKKDQLPKLPTVDFT